MMYAVRQKVKAANALFDEHTSLSVPKGTVGVVFYVHDLYHNLYGVYFPGLGAFPVLGECDIEPTNDSINYPFKYRRTLFGKRRSTEIEYLGANWHFAHDDDWLW